jgi:hypothetical protein
VKVEDFLRQTTRAELCDRRVQKDERQQNGKRNDIRHEQHEVAGAGS